MCIAALVLLNGCCVAAFAAAAASYGHPISAMCDLSGTCSNVDAIMANTAAMVPGEGSQSETGTETCSSLCHS